MKGTNSYQRSEDKEQQIENARQNPHIIQVQDQVELAPLDLNPFDQEQIQVQPWMLYQSFHRQTHTKREAEWHSSVFDSAPGSSLLKEKQREDKDGMPRIKTKVSQDHCLLSMGEICQDA